jgi:hypothetical protein
MVGSAAIGAAIAHLAFWLLLVRAWAELGGRTAAAFLALWFAGYVGLQTIDGALFFVSYVAVLDIALVFLVFKGDVHVF